MCAWRCGGDEVLSAAAAFLNQQYAEMIQIDQLARRCGC